jgi:LuxR family transcriptional regulator, maltose regulon positive regulatory protein
VAGPLLETKLHVPRRRRGLVSRPRLTDRLGAGELPPLVLVSAPAGFGKTTVLTEWLAAAPTDGALVAWLSLDQRDDDPTTFWTYLVGALRTAVPEVGPATLALLQPPQSPTDVVIATLLNELSTVQGELVLVLDDYHVIEARDVHDGVAFLLEHLPPQVHLVIATRVDPPLPLARLRARGEMVELRAADLRFAPEEAAAYLGEVMGLTLTAAEVVSLEERTEGWIAALQLAALSMQGRDDVAGFVANFAGDDRFVVDYLVEEVLQRQPEQVRSFLLQTSVLSRLTGSLCDAVTGQDGGKAMLEALERGNLFMVPLDDRRRWYRYHHLFGDVLRARLLDEDPDHVRALNFRASDWYERNGDRSAAIDHALAAEDFERAAALVESAIPALSGARQEATLRRWLEALPDELFGVRPVLAIGYVGALMSTGEVRGVEPRLRDAERWVQSSTDVGGKAGSPPGEMVVGDADAFRRLPAEIAMYRAGLALIGGNVAGTLTHAERALELAGPDDHLGRGAAASLIGLAHWRTGNLEAAHRWYSDGMATLGRAGRRSDVVGGAITLADLRIAQGRLRDAMSHYERGLRIAMEEPSVVLRGAADMHVGMAELCRERNELDSARRHLSISHELGEAAGLPQNPYRLRVEMARLRQIDGDHTGALDLLDQAQRVHTTDYSPEMRPIPAIRARMWLTQGLVDDALGWARERGLSADDDLDHLHEFEHVTLARTLLARHAVEGSPSSLADAVRLLGRLLRAAEDGQRGGSVLEILVLQALALQARGDVPAALTSLGRAIALGEPEGYVRIVVDEGAPMAALLRAIVGQGSDSAYVRRLLAALDVSAAPTPVDQGLVEPLSPRELDVLRLLGTQLDGPEIARQLFVSLNTVRTHTKNIYAKLGVNNRRAAVHRGEELDLMAAQGDQVPARAVVRDR